MMRAMRMLCLIALALPMLAVTACTPRQHRLRTDKAAYGLIDRTEAFVFGEARGFTIEQIAASLRRRIMEEQGLPYATPASVSTLRLEPIERWPRDNYLERYPDAAMPALQPEELTLTLLDAVQVAALNSRDFQDEKEAVFRSALRLELERDEFRTTLTGILEGEWSTDRTGANTPTGVVTGLEGTGTIGATQRLLNGMVLSLNLGIDVAKLFSPSHLSSNALFADGSVSLPLLRGRGRHIVGEPLTQAQRDLIYALFFFERFKRTFAVDVASQYLAVLQAEDQVANTRQNYIGLIASARRARRLADAGSLPEIQVDQAIQDELRARDRWVRAREDFARRRDGFKLVLGLPPDARIELDRDELERLQEALRPLAEAAAGQRDAGPIPPADAPIELREPVLEGGGPLEMEAAEAIALALENRLDLRIAEGRVRDAQRGVVVAADGLRAELTLLGTGTAGERRTLSSVALPNSRDIELDRGIYTALLTLDLPLERTAEGIAYRESLLALEESVRALQETEDQAKLEAQNGLRDLLVAREGLQIQAQAIRLAERRVRSTDMFLQAGRVEIRDLLEAQEALLEAQNALTAAMVDYRVAELGLQRDLGLLEVDDRGLWTEFRPEEKTDDATEGTAPNHVRSLIN